MCVCFLNSVDNQLRECECLHMQGRQVCTQCSQKLLILLILLTEVQEKGQCKVVSKGSTGPHSGVEGAALHLAGNSAEVEGSSQSPELYVASDSKASANGQVGSDANLTSISFSTAWPPGKGALLAFVPEEHRVVF